MSKPKPRLEEMTLRELRKIASLLNIPRYSRMRKAQLLKTIQIKKNNLHSNSILDSSIKKKQANSANANNLIREKILANLLGLENIAIEEREKKLQINPILHKYSPDFLADVDDDLGELPQGYGEKKIVLMASGPQWAYAYWDISQEHKEKLIQQGGLNLSLRLYDVTDIDSNYQNTHKSLEYICNELARDWYLPVPLSDRDYIIEIGYRCIDGKWLSLARSQQVRIPPLYPTDVEEDVFVSIPWEKPLNGEKVYVLPSHNSYKLKRKPELLSSSSASRVDSSLYRQVEHIPGSITSINPISSYQFASGIGMWASGGGSGRGLMSGMGFVSGAGFSADLSRQFWLLANAKLTIYGATVPNAKVTIGNQEIELNTDGTFSFQVSFPDGVIDCPIVAVSPDGEETRSIQMKFDRQTNPREEQISNSNDFTEQEQTSPIQIPINDQTKPPETSNYDDASDWFPPIR